MKKIIVFWDNKGFDKELSQNESFVVCNCQSEFNTMDEASLRQAAGFLVLCELPWNHESAKIPRTEFGGIRLVQRFIRDKMSLKAPVVFASFSDASSICETHREYKIIKTPALQHRFVKLPASRKELVREFLNMNNMSETELAYTKLVYCDIKGLLVQINHALGGRDKSDQDNYRKDLEYVIKEQFNNDQELLKTCRDAGDLSTLCKTLMERLEASGNSKAYNGFLEEQGHETIRILMIEDEKDKDSNVRRFVDYIQEMGKKAAEQKEVEIERFKEEAVALKKELEELKETEKGLEKEVIELNEKAVGLAKRKYDDKALKKINRRTTNLKKRIEELEEIKKGRENEEELKRRVLNGDCSDASERTKEKALMRDVKTIEKTAKVLERIANEMEGMANELGSKEIEMRAISLKGKANTLKEMANELKKRPFTTPLFTLTVENNTDNIEYGSNEDELGIVQDLGLMDFDVVICDIEIRNEEDELITLGFNVIEKMAKEYKRPLYYIVTNVSRSFYDQIKTPYVRRIRLKEEVFGTKESIETFLYGIKEVFDNRKAEAAEKENKYENLFNTVFDFINNEEAFSKPKQFGKPFIEVGEAPKAIQSYDDVENEIVKAKTQHLIEHFLSLFKDNGFASSYGGDENFQVYNKNCEKMREYIKATIGLGNGNLDKNVAKHLKENQTLTDKDISSFIVRLVLRRFFLYVRWFIEQCGLMQSFEKVRRTRKVDELNKMKKFTINDIACRAISDQHKTLTMPYEDGRKEGRHQSHCLDETLLFANLETLRLTDNEEAFVNGLRSQELGWLSITKQQGIL